jgi:DivIVA domain-containing protein
MTPSPRLAVGDIRNVEFPKKRWGAYNPDKIDQLLKLIAQRLDAGASPVDLINTWSRSKSRSRNGYDSTAVEHFLARVVQAFPDTP